MTCYLYSALSVSGTCLFPELPGVGHGVRTRSDSTHANKSKVVLVHYVKAVWGVEVHLHSLSTSALDGSGYSASRLVCFAAGQRRLNGPQNPCGTFRDEKFLAPAGNQTAVPRSSSH